MKFEQDLVAVPGAVIPLGAPGRELAIESRREIRVLTDALISDALQANQLPPLLEGCCDVMLRLARALNAHGLAPEVPHFIQAATALIEEARTVFDAGLRVDDPERTLIGAVMIELTVRGIFHALSSAEKPLDYEGMLRERLASEGSET